MCQNCDKKSQCGKVVFTFNEAIDLVDDAFATKPVEEAHALLEGAAGLLDQKSPIPNALPSALNNAKDFSDFFNQKKVVDQI